MPAPLRTLRPDAVRHVADAPRPAYRFLAALAPHPRRDPAGSLYGHPEHVPGLPAEQWRNDRSYLLGIDLYHDGYLWEAHEAWEACYFAARDRARKSANDETETDRRYAQLLQSLIQLAAAEIQAHLGVGAGVRYLARRVGERLRIAAGATSPGESLAGLDVRALTAEVERRFAAALSDESDDQRAAVVIDPPILLNPA